MAVLVNKSIEVTPREFVNQCSNEELFALFHLLKEGKYKHRIRKVKSAKEIEQIIEVICNYFKVKVDDLIDQTRKKVIVKPRHVAMYILCKHTKLSQSKIGLHFGGRDHTTVINARDNIINEMEQDKKLNNDVIEIENQLKLKNII